MLDHQHYQMLTVLKKSIFFIKMIQILKARNLIKMHLISIPFSGRVVTMKQVVLILCLINFVLCYD